MTTAQTIKKLQKGFTLIELLIVMAVVGVLAGIVLVAINPSEQLMRSRDTQRKSVVGTLGRAMQAYIAGQGITQAPAATGGTGTGWQTMLKNAGDIKATVATTGNTACLIAANNGEGNYCYAVNGAVGDFWIWTFVENASDKLKAGNGAACGVGTAGAYVFDSAQGKSGLGCVTTTAALSTTPTLY